MILNGLSRKETIYVDSVSSIIDSNDETGEMR